MGCRLWGRTESDTTEATEQQQQHYDNPGVEEGWDLLWGDPCTLLPAPPVSLRGASLFGPGLSLRLPCAPSASFREEETAGILNIRCDFFAYII